MGRECFLQLLEGYKHWAEHVDVAVIHHFWDKVRCAATWVTMSHPSSNPWGNPGWPTFSQALNIMVDVVVKEWQLDHVHHLGHILHV